MAFGKNGTDEGLGYSYSVVTSGGPQSPFELKNSSRLMGPDAKAIAAFGKAAQTDATNGVMRAFGPSRNKPRKVSENNATPGKPDGMSNVTGDLGTVYDQLVRQANAIAQRYLRGGNAAEGGSQSIGDVAKGASESAPKVQTGREPDYARDGQYGDAEAPYEDIGGYRNFYGGVDPTDADAMAAARQRAQEDYDYMNDNGGFAE